MTTSHIDQLAQWYADAEHGAISKGDTVIIKVDGGYAVETSNSRAPNPIDVVRILARAPKPKPAWHDAVAVIAHTARFSERRPFALTHTKDVLDPYNTEWITRDDLIDPIPLIEAKVTDEMIERGYRAENTAPEHLSGPQFVRRILAAALGIEAV